MDVARIELAAFRFCQKYLKGIFVCQANVLPLNYTPAHARCNRVTLLVISARFLLRIPADSLKIALRGS